MALVREGTLFPAAKVGYEKPTTQTQDTARVLEVKGSKRSGTEGRGRGRAVSPPRRRESISSSLSLRVILPLTRPRFSSANYRSLIRGFFFLFARKIFKTKCSIFISLRSPSARVPRNEASHRASPPLTRRSMRIYILSRGGIATHMAPPIFLRTYPRPEFFECNSLVRGISAYDTFPSSRSSSPRF